jgi:tRNA nucleotidyltransferase (CCA-adding enzyme)
VSVDVLSRIPAGLREALAGRDDVWVVGGAVRDALLGREPKDVDLVVAGDALALAQGLGAVEEVHDRFGTVAVAVDGAAVNVAMARSETYPEPGALPEVAPAALEEDLARRDFTVNAIAADLGGGLHEVPGAQEDIAAGRLRVLHDRSFLDDPTRLWRLARYAARLGFGIEPETERLAREAVAAGALDTVSGPRIGNELLLALREPDPVAALVAASELGLIGPGVPRGRIADALALLPDDGDAGLLALGAVFSGHEVRSWLDELGVPARERDVIAAVAAARPVEASRPSEIAAALRGAPVEAAAWIGASDWVQRLRHVRLEIGGEDLLAAGIPEGPELGARLQRALDAKLDGEADGREQELAVALA